VSEFQAGRREVSPKFRRKRSAPADGIARCEFCKGKILWAFPVPNPRARSEAGRNPKPMPLDYEPSEYGRYTVYAEAPSADHPSGCVRVGELTRGQVAGWRAAGKPTYERHFRTCPKKEEWGKLGKPYGHTTIKK
jgi:hypothetical protein